MGGMRGRRKGLPAVRGTIEREESNPRAVNCGRLDRFSGTALSSTLHIPGPWRFLCSGGGGGGTRPFRPTPLYYFNIKRASAATLDDEKN
jgi:hypothetical protein